MKSPKIEMELELPIDFSEITHKGLQRMLRTALSQINNRQKPLHQRDDEDEATEVDDDTNEADKENSKLVELHQTRGTPAPIPTTGEDFPEAVAEKLPKKKSPKGKQV